MKDLPAGMPADASPGGIRACRLIVGFAFVFSLSANVSYYSNREYDREACEEITWLEDHLEALDSAYAAGDLKTVEKLCLENSRAVKGWYQYPSYCLKKEYESIIGKERIDLYALQKILYFCFDPEFFAGRGTL